MKVFGFSFIAKLFRSNGLLLTVLDMNLKTCSQLFKDKRVPTVPSPNSFNASPKPSLSPCSVSLSQLYQCQLPALSFRNNHCHTRETVRGNQGKAGRQQTGVTLQSQPWQMSPAQPWRSSTNAGTAATGQDLEWLSCRACRCWLCDSHKAEQPPKQHNTHTLHSSAGQTPHTATGSKNSHSACSQEKYKAFPLPPLHLGHSPWVPLSSFLSQQMPFWLSPQLPPW